MAEKETKSSPEPSPDRRKWRYPEASENPEAVVFIYEKWCKSCGICYSMCPSGVFTSDKSGLPIVSDPDACTACGLCEMLCPDMAITVYKERRKKGDGAEKNGNE